MTDGLWRDHRFTTYWAGQSVSQLGDRVSELALPLIAVTMLQASPTAVGLLTAAVWAPNLLSLVVGAWVDQRPSKRRLLVVANLVQALAVIGLPVAFWLGQLSMWQLYAAALVLGAGGVLYQTSYPTFFTHLVRRDQYVEANSLLSTTRSGSFIAGPAIGGALVQAVTAPVAMVADAVSFLARPSSRPAASPTSSRLTSQRCRSHREGVRHRSDLKGAGAGSCRRCQILLDRLISATPAIVCSWQPPAR